MSNIYYIEKKIFRDKTSILSSEIVTLDNITKILSSNSFGVSFANKEIPLHNISWRNEEIFYNHPDFGNLFIPRNIHLTNGKKDYFIVIIDNEIEIRNWSGFRSPSKNIEEKINHVEIVEEIELQEIEKSINSLIDHLGINKTFEERYKNIKGVRVKFEYLDSFLNEIVDDPFSKNKLSEKVFKVATNPVSFFKDNQEYFKHCYINEPSKKLYIWTLIHELENLKLVFSLDWKAELEDINFAISEISKNEIKEILTPSNNPENTLKMLKLTNAKLKERGQLLLNIDTNSDSYSIFISRIEKAELIKTLAKQCKLKISEM